MRENRVLTLYYHRINIAEPDTNLLCVSPIRFRQQMLYLKRHYQIVRFEDDWTTLERDGVCITFDDGYRDNLEYALPVLEELEVPATIFVSTGTMEPSGELWWDELERWMLTGDQVPAYFKLEDEEFGCRWDTDTWEHRRNCHHALFFLMKNFITPGRREAWLAQLALWRGNGREPRRSNLTVSREDCRRLSVSKMISIGAHTVSHSSLATLDREMQEREIRMSVERLSEIIEERIRLFSYPFGNPEIDFTEETIEICRKCGIRKAASTEYSLWASSTDPYRIPRKVARDWDFGEFGRQIREYWEGRG